jgi:hypothetical protein
MNNRLYMTVRFPPLICGTQYLEIRPPCRLLLWNPQEVQHVTSNNLACLDFRLKSGPIMGAVSKGFIVRVPAATQAYRRPTRQVKHIPLGIFEDNISRNAIGAIVGHDNGDFTHAISLPSNEYSVMNRLQS